MAAAMQAQSQMRALAHLASANSTKEKIVEWPGFLHANVESQVSVQLLDGRDLQAVFQLPLGKTACHLRELNTALLCGAPGQADLRHLPAGLKNAAQGLFVCRNGEVAHVHGSEIGRHLRQQRTRVHVLMAHSIRHLTGPGIPGPAISAHLQPNRCQMAKRPFIARSGRYRVRGWIEVVVVVPASCCDRHAGHITSYSEESNIMAGQECAECCRVELASCFHDKQGAQGRTLPPARNKHASLSAYFVSGDTPPDGIEGQHRPSQ